MKAETGQWKLMRHVRGLPMSSSNRMTCGNRNRYFRRCLLVLLLSLPFPVLLGCNGGAGTGTEVVGVAGKIVSPENRAVAGVPVLLFDTLLTGLESFSDTIADTTDENGYFSLRVENFGSYLLKVKDTVGRTFMEEVDITDFDTLLGTFQVNDPGTLNGYISTSFKTNSRIILYKKDKPFHYSWPRDTFTIDSLAPGEVRVQIGYQIDDYSRENKLIIFFDSTVTISPSATTTIDTVFINEATLRKAEGINAGIRNQAPTLAADSRRTQALSASCFFPLAGRIRPFAASPLPANDDSHPRMYDMVWLFISGKTDGAAVLCEKILFQSGQFL